MTVFQLVEFGKDFLEILRGYKVVSKTTQEFVDSNGTPYRITTEYSLEKKDAPDKTA
jgi:hypothetical protein